MKMRDPVAWLLLVGLGLLPACATRPPAATATLHPSVPPSLDEARQMVAAIEAEQAAVTRDEPPTTTAAVRETLRRDQLGHFAAAREVLARDGSLEAGALMAELHTSWAQALVGLADMLHRQAAELAAELRKRTTRDEGARAYAGERAELRSLESNLAALNDRVAALRTVAAEHAAEAGRRARALADEPAHAATAQRLLAHRHLLRRDWVRFDAAAGALHQLDPDGVEHIYLRALEALDRYGDVERAETLIAAVIRRQPHHARAHALRLRLQREPNDTHHQLGQLRRASPHHPLVVWAGGGIDEDYRSWEGARAATGP